MHMDLFGPTRTLSMGGKKYGFVIVNNYSRYAWVYFLAHKHESFKVFEIFYKRVPNEKGFYIYSIRSDHEIEFENVEFKSFFKSNGIFHNFSSTRIAQQNRLVERKIELCKKWLGPCFVKAHFLNTYGEKQ